MAVILDESGSAILDESGSFILDEAGAAPQILSPGIAASLTSAIAPDVSVLFLRHLGGRVTVTPALRGRILRSCLGGSVQHVPKLRGRVIANPQD